MKEIYIEQYKKYYGPSKEEFLYDYDKQAVDLYAMSTAIQACIDLGNAIIAEKNLPEPSSYKEIFCYIFSSILSQRN